MSVIFLLTNISSSAASPDRVDAERSEPVRLRQVQVRRQGEPEVRHGGVREAPAVPERLRLRARADRAAHRGQLGGGLTAALSTFNSLYIS